MSRKFIWITISRRYLMAFAVLVVLLYVFTIPESYHLAVLSTTVSNTSPNYDVVIDAGHGGIDSGGIGQGDVYEKHIVLDIALQLRDYLEQAGLTVGMTREADTDVTHLATRRGTRHQRDLDGRFVALHEGTLGISIHANVAKTSSEQGALVFYMRDSYIDQQYARMVLENIERIQVLNHNTPVPRSNLLLLKAKPPVLLVEVGFLSNPSDLAKLVDPEFRQTMAKAMSDGILEFFNIYKLEQTE